MSISHGQDFQDVIIPHSYLRPRRVHHQSLPHLLQTRQGFPKLAIPESHYIQLFFFPGWLQIVITSFAPPASNGLPSY